MTDNVGLSTPRGSGTSGYVQRNLSHLKPRQHPYSRGPSSLSNSNSNELDSPRYQQRQPDAEILVHERKRAIEVEVFALRDKLEEAGALDEDEIDEQCEALRKKLTTPVPTGPSADKGKNGRAAAGAGGSKRDLKSYQVHELAAAKIEETEKLRKALGISGDYEEGGHWRRQDERKREAMAKEAKGNDDKDEQRERRRRRSS